MTYWVPHELLAAGFHDLRLAERLLRIVERFAERPEASIPQICDSQTETQAAYRFFDNSAVTVDEILQPHRVRPNDKGNPAETKDCPFQNRPTSPLRFMALFGVASHLGNDLLRLTTVSFLLQLCRSRCSTDRLSAMCQSLGCNHCCR